MQRIVDNGRCPREALNQAAAVAAAVTGASGAEAEAASCLGNARDLTYRFPLISAAISSLAWIHA